MDRRGGGVDGIRTYDNNDDDSNSYSYKVYRKSKIHCIVILHCRKRIHRTNKRRDGTVYQYCIEENCRRMVQEMIFPISVGRYLLAREVVTPSATAEITFKLAPPILDKIAWVCDHFSTVKSMLRTQA